MCNSRPEYSNDEKKKHNCSKRQSHWIEEIIIFTKFHLQVRQTVNFMLYLLFRELKIVRSASTAFSSLTEDWCCCDPFILLCIQFLKNKTLSAALCCRCRPYVRVRLASWIRQRSLASCGNATIYRREAIRFAGLWCAFKLKSICRR